MDLNLEVEKIMKTKQGEFFSAKLFRVGAMVLMLAAFFVSQNAFAQGTRGTIRGTVTDPNGAVVPNATVVLTNIQKGTKSTVQTNESGVYQFLEVEPATYRIVVSAPNFADTTLVDVKVEPNRNLLLDATLQIGQVENQVTVTAGAELIDRESPTLGTTVDNRRIVGLPLDGRNVLDLALLQPGVAPAGGGFGSGLGIRVNGSRGVENNLTLDGANNNEVAVGGAIGGQPRPDAVQEFRILSSNFEADFGRNTGSVINVVTKSGGNEFHGNGRFFYRPTKLSAAEFFANADTQRQGQDVRRKFERKDYGGNIGGPIYFLNFGEGVPIVYDGKDRSFFFVDYERRYQDIGGQQVINSIPTAAERAGDFSGDPGRPGGCPGGGTGICDPATGLPFPGGIIPQNRFSPIALWYLQFFPEPTPSGSAVVTANELTENNYLTMRFDHSVTQNHIINFTFNYFDFDQDDPFAFGGSVFPGFGASDRRKTRNWVGRYTYVINPDLVNYLSIGIAKNKQPSVAPVNRTTPEEIGFTADFVASREFVGPPQIRLFDRNLRIGNSIQGPQSRVTENYQIQDSINWVVGSHRLKFGVDATKYKQGQDFVFINQSFLTFSGRFRGNSTGDDFADFLIGNSPIAAQYGAAGRRDYRQLAFAGFAQDTWRATKRLTLSFGLRYEYTSPLKDLLDRVAYYREGATSTLLRNGTLIFEGRRIVAANPNNLPVGLVYVGDPDPVLGGTVPRGGVEPDKNNWAPRFGFAYAFGEMDGGFFDKLLGDNQTVIRGGIGMYYGAVIGDTILQQLTAPGYNGTNVFYFPNGGTLADPFAPDPWPNYDGVQVTRPNPFLSTDDIVIGSVLNQFSQPTDPFLKTPQTVQFNLTLERSFARDYIFGISYVGNRAKKQYVREEINPALGTLLPAPAGYPAPTTSNGNVRRRNLSIQRGLPLLTSAGESQYDALQVNLQKRFSDDGLSFQVAYTFSKSINNADTQRGGLDILDRRFGRGLSDDDKPHRFVSSFTYELPFFRNTSGFLNRLIDGWGLNGIYTYQSGDLISVGNPNDELGTGGGVISFADLGEPFQNLDTRGTDGFGFNPGAFREFTCDVNGVYQPTPDCPNGPRRGTSGRNQFRLDNPINNFDVALVKKTRLFNERNYLELRFEAFNVFNTAQFTGINTNLNDVVYNTPNDPSSGINMTETTFGKFTDTRPSRIIQLGIRLTF